MEQYMTCSEIAVFLLSESACLHAVSKAMPSENKGGPRNGPGKPVFACGEVLRPGCCSTAGDTHALHKPGFFLPDWKEVLLQSRH